jgi:RimJ/RimL family protein N-acetyltransferase
MIEEIRSELVTLRRYRQADIPELVVAVQESIERLHPWLPWCGSTYEPDEAVEWVTKQKGLWDQGREFEFSIRDCQEVLVGGCGLNEIKPEHQMANLGYWLRSGHTGRGYATEATRLLADFGLQQLGMNRVEIVAAVENTPSQKVAERAGAAREGILKGRLLIHGRSHDAILYSLVQRNSN